MAIPTRRKLLGTVGGAVGILLAGCVGGDETGPIAGNENQNAAQTDSNQTNGGDSTSGADTTSADEDDSTGTTGENDSSQSPEGFPESCPEYDRVETVICYDTADLEEFDCYLEPSERTLTTGESVDFTLRNESERILETNFYNWVVHKHVDGEWHHIAPLEWPQPLMYLAPGERHSWTLTVENDDVLTGEPASEATGTDGGTLHGLGGGYYAFRGRGWFEDESHEEAIAFAAMFELEGDALSLVPTDAIENTQWDGETLVAESSRGDPKEHRRAAYELERIGGDAERTLITEQVYRYDQLRDALALAHEHDADTVRLEEYTGSIPPFARSPDGRFVYEGVTYEVTTDELE